MSIKGYEPISPDPISSSPAQKDSGLIQSGTLSTVSPQDKIITDLIPAQLSHLRVEAEVPALQMPISDLSKSLSSLSNTCKNLEQYKNTNPDFLKNKPQFNESLFQISKDLHMLKQLLIGNPEARDTLQKLEKRIYQLNPHLPKIEGIVGLFGAAALQPTLEQTVKSLCQSYPHTPRDLLRDCHLFSCDPIEMQAMYVKRLVKVQQTGFSLSTVSLIENTGKEIMNSKTTKSEERQIDQHRVIFIPKGDKIQVFVKERFLDQGSFKAAALASNYGKIRRSQDRGKMVILQPIKFVRKMDKQQQQKLFKAIEKEAEIVDVSHTVSPSIEGTGPSEKTQGRPSPPSSPEEVDSSKTQGRQSPPSSPEEVDSSKTQGRQSPPSSPEEVDSPKTQPRELLPSSPEQASLVEHVKPGFVPLIHVREATKDSQPAPPSVSISDTEGSIAQTSTYEKEARMAWELGHLPGIWPTHKVIKIDGEITIIQKAAGYSMTLTNGEHITAINLAKISELFRKGLLTVPDQIAFLKMIGDFLNGVQSLHQQGVIHRDLKPANILCSEIGGGGVSDFGVSCTETISYHQGSEESVDNPAKRRLTGTNNYIAPEITKWSQTDKWKKIGIQADMWSIGIILWELLSGKKAHTHPAIERSSEVAYEEVGKLIEDPALRKSYEDRFPEPEDKNGLLYLIWSCNRVDPTQRLSIETLQTKYHEWAKEVGLKLQRGEATSVPEALKSLF